MEQPELIGLFKRHFQPSFEMLKKIIEICPDKVWCGLLDEPPVWLQMYHVLFGVQVWFGNKKEYSYPDFGKSVTPVFEDEQHDSISRSEMTDYALKISQQVEEFFARMTPKELLNTSVLYDKFTNTDAVLEQIRHIIYHAARINGILKQHGIKPVAYKYFS